MRDRSEGLLTLAIIGALGLCACGGDEGSTASDGGFSDAAADAGASDSGVDAPAPDPFALWQELYEGVTASPADLEAEAERLVAAGDPLAMIEFVRDQVQTIPSSPDRFSPSTRVRFGSRGVLRAGVGTARDKVELLFQMLTRAGFSPERRSGSLPSDEAYWDSIMAPRPRRFEPVWSEDLIERARATLAGAEFEALDGSSEALQLRDTIYSALSAADLSLPAFLRADRPLMPLVRFEHQGETLEANVFDSNTPAGSPGLSSPASTTIPLGDPEPYEDVTVSLSVSTTAKPDEFRPLVSHTWKADQVVGRGIAAHFVPAMEPADALHLPIDAISELVPMLSLRGHDLTRDQMEQETYVGDLLDLSGNVIAIDAGGVPSYRGIPLVTDPSASVDQVNRMELDVQASGFPAVELRIAALDAGDAPIYGLPATAFSLTEDGAGQNFTLLQNDPGPPRVLFVPDKSSSVPAEYRGAALGALVKSVAAEIATVRSDALFRVMVVNGVTGAGEWTQDLDALEAAAIAQNGGGSALWRALAEANGLTPTLVIFITDGATTDSLTTEQASNVAQLGAVLSVDIGGGLAESILPEVAVLTGGSVFQPTTPAELAPEAKTFIEAARRFGYLLQYQAPLDGAATRAVEVTVNGGAAPTASGNYSAPTEAKTPSVLQVRLTVTIGRDSVSRIIVGASDDPEAIDTAAIQQMRRELLSFNLIGFEGGDPTPHALAKDLLRNKLNLAKLADALESSSPSDALLDGIFQMPVPLIAALRMPIATDLGSTAFPAGIRAAIYRRIPGVEAVRDAVDVLPLGGYSSAAATAEDRLKDALQTTARVAVVEANLFETSTLSVLEGAEVFAAGPLTRVDDAYPELTDPALIERWEARLDEHLLRWKVLPVDATRVAFWVVDPDTGSATAILEDGTGGGSTENLELAITFLNMLDLAATGVGANWQLGFWISLSKAVLKQVIRATIAISTLGVEPPPAGSIYDAVEDMLCDMIKDKVFGAWGEAGERIDLLDSAAEMYGGDGIPCTL